MKRRDLYVGIALAFFAVLSLGHMLGGALPVGHDMSFESVRLVEYRDALSTQIIPRYAPHTYGGLGSPVFLFYAPLFTFGASVLSFVGSLTAGVAVWFVLLKIISVLAVYALARRFTNTLPAALLAILWCVLPYGYTDLYQRNAFAEATAFFLLPCVLYGFLQLLTTRRRLWLGLTVLATVALLLSHNITVMLVGLAAVVFAVLWSPILIKNKQVSLLFLFTVALSASLSAWFLLPAFLEKNNVHIGDVMSGKFFYANNFASWQDLLLSVDNERFIGPMVLLVALAAIITLIVKAKRFTKSDGLLASGLLFMLGATFLMTPYSGPIWQALPLLQFTQFPWRLQIFVSLGAILTLLGLFISARKYIGYTVLAMLLAQSFYVGWYKFIRTPMLYDRPDNTTVQSIIDNKLKATVGDEYLPIAINKDLPAPVAPLFAQVQPGMPLYRACGQHLPRSPTGIAAYPFLLLKENDTIVPSSSDGYLRIPQYNGRADTCVTLTLELTFLQKAGLGITVLALLCLLFLFLKNIPALPPGKEGV